LATVYATMMMVPLYAGVCPERWRKDVDAMLDKTPGVVRTNKLRIIQLLEADLKQVLRSAFARNISKLAQEKDGIISEHQYGCSHQTCISPVLNKLLTIQILIQKRTHGIVFDNNVKGCCDRIISGIALLSIRHLGYSKNRHACLARYGNNWNIALALILVCQIYHTEAQLKSSCMG
jgi:hypothetical protein